MSEPCGAGVLLIHCLLGPKEGRGAWCGQGGDSQVRRPCCLPEAFKPNDHLLCLCLQALLHFAKSSGCCHRVCWRVEGLYNCCTCRLSCPGLNSPEQEAAAVAMQAWHTLQAMHKTKIPAFCQGTANRVTCQHENARTMVAPLILSLAWGCRFNKLLALARSSTAAPTSPPRWSLVTSGVYSYPVLCF